MLSSPFIRTLQTASRFSTVLREKSGDHSAGRIFVNNNISKTLSDDNKAIFTDGILLRDGGKHPYARDKTLGVLKNWLHKTEVLEADKHAVKLFEPDGQYVDRDEKEELARYEQGFSDIAMRYMLYGR